MRKFRTSAADAGCRLGDWVAQRLGRPPEAGEALVRRGAVYVGGRRERRPEARLDAGRTIVVYEEVLAPGSAAAPEGGWRLVHEGADVIVVEKPAGLPTQATREAAGALDEQVARRWPEARLFHRLDRDASGLVLFTRRPEARRRLKAALDAGAIAREYSAVVAGSPAEDAFTIDAPIGRDPRDPRRQAARVPRGRPARTHVAVERRGATAALVEARLETGRTHQIRVHLASRGHPILGDRLYAPPDVAARAPWLALHARRLAWPGGEAVSPTPPELAALVT